MPAREPGEPHKDLQHAGLPLPRRPCRPARARTRKVAGKTLTRVLSKEQFERYRPWAENSRRLHDLEQLYVISMARAEGLARADPASTGPTPGPFRQWGKTKLKLGSALA